MHFSSFCVPGAIQAFFVSGTVQALFVPGIGAMLGRSDIGVEMTEFLRLSSINQPCTRSDPDFGTDRVISGCLVLAIDSVQISCSDHSDALQLTTKTRISVAVAKALASLARFLAGYGALPATCAVSRFLSMMASQCAFCRDLADSMDKNLFQNVPSCPCKVRSCALKQPGLQPISVDFDSQSVRHIHL